jgi:hypothetical protein
MDSNPVPNNVDTDNNLDTDTCSESDVHTNLKPSDRSGPSCNNTGNISGQSTDLRQTPEQGTLQMPITPNRRRSKRPRTNKSFGVDEDDCAESECENPSSQEDKVMCAGPGCNALVRRFLSVFECKLIENGKYHLSCVGLDVAPDGGWFCDVICRKNAGQRVAPIRKRRQIVVVD